MPNLTPEQHGFALYVHYEDASPKTPELIVYLQAKPGSIPTNEEANRINKHSEDEDLKSTLIIERTVTEDAFHRSVVEFKSFLVGNSSAAVTSAISYLKQLYPGKFEEFTKLCWQTAQAHYDAGFPKRFPLSTS